MLHKYADIGLTMSYRGSVYFISGYINSHMWCYLNSIGEYTSFKSYQETMVSIII